ncbi:MAG: flagellar biosynthesis protein FlhB [Gemmatimonadales bacterium]
MSESDGQEKTESATPRKREEAAREGRVPRSAELSAATLLLAGTATLALTAGGTIARHAVDLVQVGQGWLLATPMTDRDLIGMVQQVGRATLLALAPFFLGVIAITLLVNAVQARGIISMEPLSLKLSHIDPIAGLGRIVSLDAVVNVLKALIKLTIIGFVAWRVFSGAWTEILTTSGSSVPAILGVTRALMIKFTVLVGLAFLAIALFDYGYQVWQFEKNLRMSKQDVTQESRETEGDPAVKGRIRQLQRTMARKRMLTKVATADVVVTNPTHIAVALKYDPLISAAPIVIAMGERLMAQRIKDIARQAGVPVIENKPLARALLASAKVGKSIPPALYVAVAEIIAFVFRKKGSNLPARRAR